MKKPHASRHIVTLGMILTRKGGKMRDRRLRRAKDAKHRKFQDD